MFTYPRYKTNYDEIFISELPLTYTQLKCNSNQKTNNKQQKNVNREKIDKYCSKLIQSSNHATTNNSSSTTNNCYTNANKYKILTKYYHDKESRKNNDKEIVKNFEYLKQNYLNIVDQNKIKQQHQEQEKQQTEIVKTTSINKFKTNDESLNICFNNNNNLTTKGEKCVCYCHFSLFNNNCNATAAAVASTTLGKNNLDSSNCTIESNSSSSCSNCTNISTNSSCYSISSNSSIHSYFSMKSEYCCTQCENTTLLMEDTSISPSLSLTPSSTSSSSSLLLSSMRNNEELKSLKKANTISSEDETVFNKLNDSNKSKAALTSTSNATLDQLIKSLDDINLYLEKTFINTQGLKQQKQQQEQPSVLIKKENINNNKIKKPLILHKKISESQHEYNESSSNKKIDLILKATTPIEFDKVEKTTTRLQTTLSNNNTSLLNKYSYLNFNKNRQKQNPQFQKQMSIELPNDDQKSQPLSSVEPINNHIPYSSSTLYIPKVNADKAVIDIQVTKDKSCSHGMLNSILIQTPMQNQNENKLPPQFLVLKDEKSEERKEVIISPKFISKTQLSPNSTSSSASHSYSSLSSSLAKLSENRSTSTSSSSNKNSNQLTESSKASSLLTVETLFRDLMLDCDETIKKLDELENQKKLYQFKQEAILKTIETKNLLSIYYINKGKKIKRKSEQKETKTTTTKRKDYTFLTCIDKRKLQLSKNKLKHIVGSSLKFKYVNLNGVYILVIKKSDKLPKLNRLVYKYRFHRTTTNQLLNVYNLYINSYYMNYSLFIRLNSYKLYLKRGVLKEKKTRTVNNRKRVNIDDTTKKVTDLLSDKISAGHKSLLDEYYEKYCAITTKNENNNRNNYSSGLSQSLKRKKRARTEERLNELEKDQAFLINDCLKMKNLEVDLVDACKWLIEAGFSKYVKLFEKNKFPIDLMYVEFENPNLNERDLKAIFRRLEVLNKCSEMRVDYQNIKNEYENPDDDEEYDDENNAEVNRNINLNLNHLGESMLNNNNTLNRKKQQQKLIKDTKTNTDTVKFRKADESNDAKTTTAAIQVRQKPHLHRFYSFQNYTSTKFNRNLHNKLKSNNSTKVTRNDENKNDGYVDDVEDNGEDNDDDNDSVFSMRAKTFSLQPNSKYFSTVKNAKTVSNLLTIDNLISTHKLNLKQTQTKPIKAESSSSTSSTASESSIKVADVSKVEETKQISKTTADAIINTLNITKSITSQTSGVYSIEDNNINLAYVKLSKRKKLPENFVLSVYDNLKNGEIGNNKNEMESDDSSLNMTSSINYKIAQFVPTSSSTFSTNSSSQSSPSLINKIQSAEHSKIEISADSETLLPKIYLNEDEEDEQTFMDYKPERRDSGVGRSLTRENEKKIGREKWQSFIKSHRPSLRSSKIQISSMNVLQFSELKPFALVKITSLMEEYSLSGQKSGWNRFRAVPKFIKRHQRSINENNIKNKNVFGVPFKINIQRHGQALPQSIVQIMKYVRSNAKNTTGVFRKSGARSRMLLIREEIEKKLVYTPDNDNSNKNINCVDSQTKISNDTIDAADLLKQYFRELPECLLTNKLSQTLIDIFIYVPEEQRLEAVQYCMLLLDDENRDVLQTLLYFLNDISQHHEINKMDSKNIAICLAPTLLNLNALKDIVGTNLPLASISNNSRGAGSSSQNLASSSNNLMSNANMLNTTQLINRQCNASLECLTLMIQNPQKIFQVPKEALSKIQQSKLFEYQTPAEMRKVLKSNSIPSLNSYLNDRIEEMLKELKEKSRSWTSINKTDTNTNIEISHKKVDDENALRLWKVYTEIDAPAKEVFQKLYAERSQWDDDLTDFKIIEKIDNQIDILQYEMHVMPPQATRGYCELRVCRNSTQLPQKYSYVIYSTSIEPASNIDSKAIGDIIAVTLRNCYIIEANDNKTRLYQLYRGDYKGYSSEWYHKMEGHVLKRSIANLKQSFKK